MAKCNIQIAFDRADRTYQGGERVSGSVTVDVSQPLSCDGILLRYHWQTHGRGNRTRAILDSIDLSGPLELAAHTSKTVPFAFEAPCEPLTYHGHYLSIDHYVRVEVDVPWAIDPKCEEDYILIPGALPVGAPFARGAIPEPDKPAGVRHWGPLTWIILILFGPLLLVLAAAVGPLFMVYYAARAVLGALARRRVGMVELVTPHVVIAPGESWPIALSFTPRRDVTLNAITVRLTATERVVSGSGTKRTTHRHKVFDETFPLEGPSQLRRGQQHAARSTVALPDLAAYTVSTSDNHLEWQAKVRLDIARGMDWTRTVKLHMVPAAFVDDHPIQARGPARPPDATAPNAAQPPPRTPDAIPTAGSAGAHADSLDDLLLRLSRTGRFGDERQALLRSVADQVFACTGTIRQTFDSYGEFDDPALTGGRLLIAELHGTALPVEIMTRADRNEEIDGLMRGAEWSGDLRVIKWNDLHDRAVLHEAQQPDVNP